MKNSLAVLLLLSVSITLVFGIDWPASPDDVIEFGAGPDGVLRNQVKPYMEMTESHVYQYAASGEVVFESALPNALGNIRVIGGGSGMYQIYGNVEPADLSSVEAGEDLMTARYRSWEDLRQRLLFMIMDYRLHRFVNPETLLRNPPDNMAPTLRRLVFRQVQSDGSVDDQERVLWSWYRGIELPAGEYVVNVDQADGRVSWTDVDLPFYINMSVNGQVKLLYGNFYTYETDNGTELYPGKGSDYSRVPVTVQAGENRFEIQLRDPKGLSNTYAFTITGRAVSTE